MIEINSKENAPKIWRKSVSIGEYTKEVSVEKIENGFLVTIHESGINNKKIWENKVKKYFSKKNPLNSKEYEVNENLTSLQDVVDQLDEIL